jgi:hypothetical protein
MISMGKQAAICMVDMRLRVSSLAMPVCVLFRAVSEVGTDTAERNPLPACGLFRRPCCRALSLSPVRGGVDCVCVVCSVSLAMYAAGFVSTY